MSHSSRQDRLGQPQRIVVKVGSALLANDSGLAIDKIQRYSAELSALREQGLEVVLVSSGAVAAGCARLGWSQRPHMVHELQAAAAVGQMELVQAYESALSEHGDHAAMIVLTHDDLADRQRYLNARATLGQLLALGVVPVINENDTVATEEIRFGDNDTLAALVTNLLSADLLIILTDVAGLMDHDPQQVSTAQRVHEAAAAAAELDQMATAGSGRLGRGGMTSKVRAARLAARSGAHTLIASGHDASVLERLLAGEDLGTLLYAELTPMTARKRWIAGQLKPRGDLVLDDGAVRALSGQGNSLLAVGVVETNGAFRRGDVVRCVDRQGNAVAQGLVNYGSDDVDKLKGVQSEAFADLIDLVGEPELIHRDNLVLL